MATIVISGASRGIGLELVRQHAAQGDRVFALCRAPDKAEALCALSDASNGLVSAHAADVTSDASMRAAAAETGGAAIDILYSVAGVTGTIKPELESADWAVFDEAIEIMLKGPMRTLHAFLPQLAKGSRMINFSSQIGASFWPYGGFYAYAAAKAGLNRMMRSVSIDLRPRGIIIGLVHPGYVQTDMGGPNAEITPEESATGVRTLAEHWPIEKSGEFMKWTGEPHSW